MIIAQISDTHITLDPRERLGRRAWLERCVSAINALDPVPDIAIHTGDLTHKAKPAEFREALEILGDLRPPLYLAAGNRDERGALRDLFPALGYLWPEDPFVQYSIEDYAVRLIALDTITAGSQKGEFCEARLKSLRAALEADARPTAVFMHHPPYDLGVAHVPFQFEPRADAERLIEILNGHGNVIRVFCGHAHRPVTATLGKIPASTLPSIALDLRKGDYPPDQADAPLFQLHRYSPKTGFTSETRAA